MPRRPISGFWRSPVTHSLVLSLAALTKASTTFDTTCPSPSTAVNFVSSADTRGTVDIFRSCAFAIVACTWTVLHLNVLEQREDRDPGWLGSIKRTPKGSWTSVKWMIITVIAPEVSLWKYWGDLENATEDLQILSDKSEDDGVLRTVDIGALLFRQ